MSWSLPSVRLPYVPCVFGSVCYVCKDLRTAALAIHVGHDYFFHMLTTCIVLSEPTGHDVPAAQQDQHTFVKQCMLLNSYSICTTRLSQPNVHSVSIHMPVMLSPYL
jgi:hypothetical protein